MLTLNFLDKKTKKERQKALKTGEHAVTGERILILLLRNEGKKYDEISELLGCCKRQVWYWCNNGNPKEIESLRDKRKKGNHRKATEEYIEKLTEIIIKEPEEFGYKFGRWTVSCHQFNLIFMKILLFISLLYPFSLDVFVKYQ